MGPHEGRGSARDASPDAGDAVLSSPPPQLAEADAERLALAHYGVRARARSLTSERDRNFLMTADDGTAWLLKIANAAEDVAVLDFQLAALDRLAAQDPGLPVPRVARTAAGATIAETVDASTRTHHVAMLSFLPGRVLAEGPGDDRHAAEIGRLLARVDRALAGFSHPAEGRELQWDLTRAPLLRRHLPAIEDAELRDHVEYFLDAFDHYVAPRLADLPWQVIHNDMNPNNIIVADDATIAGIIDFGDMVRAPRVADVAVAASYQVSEGDGLGGAGRLIAAYHALAPLDDAEIALLPVLIATRCVLTVAITAWRSVLYPENRAYILRHAPRAARVLRLLARRDPRLIADDIREICRSTR